MILISAGHSNTDPGAVSKAGDKEAVLATDLRNRIASLLIAKGLPVVTDGAGDVNRPLPEAIALAKKCDFAVELHFNASSNPSANGVEAISLPDKKEFAQKLAACVAGTMRAKLRGEAGWIDQSKSQHSRLGFVQDGKGIILELCFLSNDMELASFQTYRNLIARNLADMIGNLYRG